MSKLETFFLQEQTPAKRKKNNNSNKNKYNFTICEIVEWSTPIFSFLYLTAILIELYLNINFRAVDYTMS